jgi:glyoxylase-like metal-dependent hydrolase (beta-lactamase superfamily II)
LIIGGGKSVLFDTGMGISDNSAVVKKLTDTEIIVVNSHTHFDNIGDDAAKAFNIVNKGEAEYKLEEYYFQTMRVYEFDGPRFQKAQYSPVLRGTSKLILYIYSLLAWPVAKSRVWRYLKLPLLACLHSGSVQNA